MYTLLPALPPLLETLLEHSFWNGEQSFRRILHDVFSWLKSGPFWQHFHLGKQPKITRSHVGWVGSLTNHRNVVFGKESLNQMCRMGSCVIMMELPSYRCPQIQSFAPHSITKATKDLLVVLLCDGLALRGILMMYHTTGVKENGQYDFDFAVDQLWFFWSQGWRMLPLWWLHLGFWVVPIHPCFITCDHGVQKVGVTVGIVQHVLCDVQTPLLLLHC